MKVSIIGMGMGNPDTLTVGGRKAIEEAKLLIGADRLIKSFPDKRSVAEIYSEKIAKIIEENGDIDSIAVLMSGDTGFYSGTKKLLPKLENHETIVIPGISSMQYMAAKIGRPWQDVLLASAHGIECNVFGHVMKSEETFFLTGGKIEPKDIIEELIEFGLSDAYVYVGEKLSYLDERITRGTALDLKDEDFDSLSVVWIVRKAFSEEHKYRGSIEDDDFIRGKVPMTKQEVRGAIVSKLKIDDDDVVFDIGAGTGSIGIEIALMNETVKVYAIETNPDGIALIEENREKFSAYNLKAITGKAPEALVDLPAPDKAFIGGSKGNLKEIVKLLKEKNPKVKIVVSAIALETLNEVMNVFDNAEVTQITVAKTKEIGNYHMMMGQNPIYIITDRG